MDLKRRTYINKGKTMKKHDVSIKLEKGEKLLSIIIRPDIISVVTEKRI